MVIITAGCVALFVLLVLLLPQDGDWYDGEQL
jgi:hypothetical protein